MAEIYLQFPDPEDPRVVMGGEAPLVDEALLPITVAELLPETPLFIDPHILLADSERRVFLHADTTFDQDSSDLSDERLEEPSGFAVIVKVMDPYTFAGHGLIIDLRRAKRLHVASIAIIPASEPGRFTFAGQDETDLLDPNNMTTPNFYRFDGVVQAQHGTPVARYDGDPRWFNAVRYWVHQIDLRVAGKEAAQVSGCESSSGEAHADTSASDTPRITSQ